MMKNQDERSLRDEFARLIASKEEREQKAACVELQPLEEWQSEHIVLSALLHAPKEEPRQRRLSWRWLEALWQWRQPAPWAAATLLCLALGTWYISPTNKTPHLLIPKGNEVKTKQNPATMQIGLWLPKKQQIQPMKRRQRIASTQSIVFGVKLIKPGYIHLFHGTKGQLRAIYPRPGMGHIKRRPNKEVQLLHESGVPQRYTLEDVRGLQQFVLLVSKQPLTAQELATFSNEYKRRNTLAQQLAQAGLSAKVIGSDRFPIEVGRTKSP